MRLVVVSPLTQPVTFLTSVGYAPQIHQPLEHPEIVALDPDIYGPEMVNNYLKEALAHNKKSFILSLTSFLTYRQRRVIQPKFKMDALRLLQQLSGRTFSLMTYWLYKNPSFKDPISGVSETKITLKSLSDHAWMSYVNDHELSKSPLILNFSDPQTYTYIAALEGSLNNFLYYLPIENIDL